MHADLLLPTQREVLRLLKRYYNSQKSARNSHIGPGHIWASGREGGRRSKSGAVVMAVDKQLACEHACTAVRLASRLCQVINHLASILLWHVAQQEPCCHPQRREQKKRASKHMAIPISQDQPVSCRKCKSN